MKSTFSKLAWAFLGYLILVILFGAWVRITGSGAGCGAHWPLCDGEVVPRAPSVERMIEYTHRVTSGLCGVFGIGFLVAAWRRFGGRHLVTRAAVATMLFILVEGAVGAMLVKLELVAGDTSSLRALVVALHLGNTLLLTASAALMAWLAGRPEGTRFSVADQGGWFAVALLAIVVTSMAGAVTALGDTVFPVGSAAAAEAGSHVIVRLRILHPVLAVTTAAYLGWFVHKLLAQGLEAEALTWARRLGLLVVVQVIFGFVNIGLAAPGWAQIIHLALAQGVWVAAVLLAVAFRERAPGLGAQ